MPTHGTPVPTINLLRYYTFGPCGAYIMFIATGVNIERVQGVLAASQTSDSNKHTSCAQRFRMRIVRACDRACSMHMGPDRLTSRTNHALTLMSTHTCGCALSFYSQHRQSEPRIRREGVRRGRQTLAPLATIPCDVPLSAADICNRIACAARSTLPCRCRLVQLNIKYATNTPVRRQVARPPCASSCTFPTALVEGFPRRPT